jgi:predicted PurR-regulated permease PerM
LLAFLYLGRVVLEPLAIAVLLAFVLAPLIRLLRHRLHIGRAISVVLVVAFALSIIGAFGFMMESEISRLAGEIPQYQSNLRQKIASFHSLLVPSGALRRASNALNSLAEELKERKDSGAGLAAEGAPGARTPIPVTVQSPQPATLDYLQNLIGPLVTPVTMAGLMILFLLFVLFYREDLRDRVLRLAGTRDLHRTTEAMDDAGSRLSQFFLIQSAINGSFGVFIGIALWLAGVPNPILWGMLAALLRFVPYVGTPIAALFPLMLAAAIDPGWTKVLVTAGVFFGGEIVTGQAIEPVLQGQHTGLSPIAIVLAQLFWTLIWGAPGLLLAVPITVCIAVMGKHIDALSFLGVILGDEPALAPHEAFYQRILAADATEATFQAEERLAKERLSDYYDAVPMQALALAQMDAAAGKLSTEKQLDLCDTIEEIVEDLADYSDEPRAEDDTQAAETKLGATGKSRSETDQIEAAIPSQGMFPIALVAARGALDQSACLLLGHILEKRGLECSIVPYAPGKRPKHSDIAADTRMICVSCFGASHTRNSVRYLIRRWRRLYPKARFLVCFWLEEAGSEKLEEWQSGAGAAFAAASIKGAADICYREACAARERSGPANSDRCGPLPPAVTPLARST